MAGYNNNSVSLQAFKDYQVLPEQTEEVLEEFSQWLEDEYDSFVTMLPWPQNNEELALCLRDAVKQYLMQDGKSQALIKAGEQELLKKWSK